ncbi:MAG TPA: peroxiredoxin-like family protein [Terriglobales bacterium]|nr:peroxiredoxin-like family protein [Terriglobales bacterium]
MKWRSLEESSPASERRTLHEIYADRKQLIAKYVPPEITAVHDRVIAELESSGVSSRVLKIGSKAPDFELPDQNRNLVHSSELLKDRRHVICFFRGRWCPFCVGQLEAMNAIYPDLQKADAALVAISPQTVHQSFLMADQHHLRFPLLSDTGNQVARQFGVVYRVPEYQQEIYERAFVNLAFINGDTSWELPIPATYVVDRDSTVLYAYANPDYTERPEPGAILQLFPQLSC